MEYFYNLPSLTGSVAKWEEVIDEELEARMEFLHLNKDNLSDDECREYYGFLGEKSIIKRLMKCCQPMCIIHDLFIKYNDIEIQNDLLVVMSNAILIIECKNWSGSFKVDEFGNFIKTKKYDLDLNEYTDIEIGVYSPVSQAIEHCNLIRCIIKEQLFQEFHDIKSRCINSLIPLVVIGNEKTVVDLSFAPTDVKHEVIKYDQICRYVEQFIDSNCFHFTEHEIEEISQKIINMDINSENLIFI